MEPRNIAPAITLPPSREAVELAAINKKLDRVIELLEKLVASEKKSSG